MKHRTPHFITAGTLIVLAAVFFCGSAGAAETSGESPLSGGKAKPKQSGPRLQTRDEQKKFQRNMKNVEAVQRIQQIDNAKRVQEVNQQLQSIIRMNESMKASQTAQAAKVQEIGEQARIHQRILKSLQTANPRTKTVTSSDADEILRQEKIRLIREQTQRNQQLMENLERTRRH